MKETMLLSGMFFLMFFFYSHPFLMVLSLTLLCFPIMMMSYQTHHNTWNNYTLFLVFLGGLLVIFVYLSALIPNEMFFSKKNTVLFLLLMLFFMTEKNMLQNINLKNSLNMMSNFSYSFSKTYLIFMMCYVLASLFSCLYLCNKTKSPLKMNTYGSTKKHPTNQNY